MNYIVFDLEWNQPQPYAKTDPDLLRQLPFEVIEIGAVRLDDHFAIVDTFYGRIRPRHYKKINPFIAKVTKQDTASLRQGRPFKEVAGDFVRFVGDAPLFLSWSPSDPYVWLQNLSFFTPDLASPLDAIDLQLFFQIKIEPDQLGQQRSLENTLDLLQLEKPADFHSALIDAKGTADVLRYLAGHKMCDDLADYKAEITDLMRVSSELQANPPGSLRPVLEGISSSCPHGDADLILSAVKKSSRFKATRMAACPRHGLIRETLSRGDMADHLSFTQKFLFVGASFLPFKTKKKTKPKARSKAKDDK